jgi:hypothetical protein
LLLLHQLSIKLLSCSDPQQCIRSALELVQGRTKASVVGFLSVGDDRNLRPKIVLPDYAQQRVNLSEDLMRLVCDEGHAVWIANQKNAEAEKAAAHFSDAQCIPLVSGKRVLGAFHLYLKTFRQSHFDFACRPPTSRRSAARYTKKPFDRQPAALKFPPTNWWARAADAI